MSEDLTTATCRAASPGEKPLEPAAADALLACICGWERDGTEIHRLFRFADYDETMAFVNAVAWISRRQDHHPELAVGYNRCRITYTTHAVGGLSRNDFICAARVNALLGL